MTSNASTAPVIVPTDVDGLIRVFTPGRPETVTADIRKAARTAAQQAHGGVMVGKTPAHVPAKFRGVLGFGWDFTPVGKSRAAVVDLTPAKGKAGKAAPAVVFAAPVAETKAERKARKAAAKAAPVKAVPSFLGKRDDVSCEACQDYGVVRKAGKRAGGAYKTANGAATATAGGNSLPCTAAAHGRKGKRRTA